MARLTLILDDKENSIRREVRIGDNYDFGLIEDVVLDMMDTLEVKGRDIESKI
jgi:hypothetical protein